MHSFKAEMVAAWSRMETREEVGSTEADWTCRNGVEEGQSSRTARGSHLSTWVNVGVSCRAGQWGLGEVAGLEGNLAVP